MEKNRGLYRLLNRTNYFDPETDKTHVVFQSPDSFCAKSSKIQGYLTRIYYEFKRTGELGGQSFFYTLTYNDAHVPRYKDIVCFDYHDLVYLLNGGLKKILERKFGTQLKYFVGAELGEGKGLRGLDSNPHYHVIFFLSPKTDSPVPYKVINPKVFRHLVKKYWQGFDEYTDGYRDYRTAVKGIAKEGDNLGLITDFRACSYCAKYVTKDASLVKYTKYLQRELALELQEDFKKSPELIVDFLYDVVFPRYNIPANACLDLVGVQWRFTPVELYLQCCPEHSSRLLQTMDVSQVTPFLVSHGFISECGLQSEFADYVDKRLQEKVSESISEFRNRYSNKCRISQGVGLSALNELSNDYKVKVPDKSGWKYNSLCLYYYRKLFTDVVKDEKGNNIRVLNDRGLQYKLSILPEKISRLADKAFSYSSSLSPELLQEVVSSKYNISVTRDYDYYQDFLFPRERLAEVCRIYAEFKLVYEDRFFSLQSSESDSGSSFPVLDLFADYKRFINPSYYQVDYSPCRLSYFLDSGHEGYLPYWAHSAFHPYVYVFRLLDLLCVYFRVSSDRLAEKAFNQERHLRQFHGRGKLNQYFKPFYYGKKTRISN